MTNEELDRARAEEAPRLAREKYGATVWTMQHAILEALRLAREDWRPTDPDLIEARKVAATLFPFSEPIIAGEQDELHAVQAALAALKRGRELERGQ